ncbi:ABC transporter permease [Enterovirga sp.]|uniref:ABC transporter permease n=1 Tax=Enterovirga sp. TaxID=2026350 RepID=UPI002606A37E|nr:ABC transporter permease [Enterovirga sp.]MDB5589608.1 transporter permease [Enterovirga sp.]
MASSPVLDLSASEQARAPLAAAVRDVVGGAREVQLWGTMGWLDIRQRYSRSVMGPFWVTLTLAAFVAGLGVTYGALFRIPLAEYLPYLTVGMVVWTLISTLLIDGCNVFIAATVAIKQMPAPLTVHVYRLIWRGLIIFGHNAIIIAAVLLLQPANALMGLLPSLLGLLVVCLNGIGFALTLGTLAARFRDIPPLMTNVVQMMFFITPVLWTADTLGDRKWIALANPFFHLIEIVRAPLIGAPFPALSWSFALGLTAVNLLVALLLYARFRWRVPYWL